MMKRRTFLKGGLMMGAGAGSFGLSSPLMRLAHAASTSGQESPFEDRYFIFCYFSGGWDILLSLDPRDPMVFTPGAVQTTGIYPGYELLEGSDGMPLYTPGGEMYGPYMGPLMNWMNDICVVRGMSMETLTHAAGMRRFLTGKAPSGLQARGSSGATWLASKLGETSAIPNLALRVESYNVDQPKYATGLQVSSVSDLVLALSAGDPQLPASQQVQLEALLEQFSQCNASQASPIIASARAGRQKAKEMVEAGFSSLFQFQRSGDPYMEQLREDFGISATGTATLSSPEAQGAAAVIALTSGMSRVASVRVAAGLDTHYEDNWTTEQGPNQEQGFQVVAAMMKRLQETEYKGTGASWLDHTTLIGFSEFCRSPNLNGNLGRDHSLTNACLLAGAGIKGGQVIGRSSDVGMTPTLTDLGTGQSAPSGAVADDYTSVVRPEHILRALMVDAGIPDDEADLRVEPLTAILKDPT